MAVFAVADPAEAARRQATRLVKTYFARNGSEWTLRGAVEDAETHRTVQPIAGPADSPATIGVALASALWNGSAAQSWKPEAVEALGRAMLLPPAQAVPFYKQAVDADPSLEEAWLRWIQTLAATGSRTEAEDVLARAPKTSALAVLAANLTGSLAARTSALKASAEANPSDWETWIQYATVASQARQYREGAAAFERALSLNPGSASLHNDAAYTFELAGQHERALRAARESAKLLPGSVNPLDTLGEIHAMAGEFKEAEKAFLDAQAKDPRFLGGALAVKAALMRRLAGDQQGADKLFGGTTGVIARAQWDYSSGRRPQAEAALAGSNLAAAKAQLALWRLAEGDPVGARKRIEEGAALATKPDEKSLLSLAQSLLTGNVANPYLKGASLLLAGKAAEAVPLLEQAAGSLRTGQSSHVPVLLAWAYLETGKQQEAAELLKSWPIPRSQAEDYLEFLTYPRAVELRKRAGIPVK